MGKIGLTNDETALRDNVYTRCIQRHIQSAAQLGYRKVSSRLYGS